MTDSLAIVVGSFAFKVKSDEQRVKNSQYSVFNHQYQIVNLARTTCATSSARFGRIGANGEGLGHLLWIGLGERR